MQNRTIFITGATAGLGRAIAVKFAAAGWKLILTGRRKERLEALQSELAAQYNTASFLLHYDIRERQANEYAIKSLPKEWQGIDILVNNAGLAAGRDHFETASLDDWDAMIDTNIKGLLYVSKFVIPLMIAKGNGHIINIGSIAAKEVYEKGNVYCATKSAVEAISKGMRIDLLQHGIKVTALHPGAVNTEFSLVRFKGDKAKADAIYDGYQPLTDKDIADIVYYTTTLPPHVCINDLVVTPLAQANSNHLLKKM